MWVKRFRNWKIRLDFTVDPDDICVCAFLRLGDNPDAPIIGQRSKFFRVWALANGGPPRRDQKMAPEVIADPELGFTVQVTDCTTDDENKLKDDALVYSRVEKVLSVKRVSGQADMQPSLEAFKPQSNEVFKPLSSEAYKQVSPFPRSI
jgi:hypothetical protein